MLNAKAVLLTRESAKMAIRIRAAAEFIEACAAESTVSGVPPDEICNRRRRGEHHTQRDEQ